MSAPASQSETSPSFTARGFLALFGLGLLGILTLAITVATDPSGLPPEVATLHPIVLMALVTIQPAILLAIAILVGLYTAPGLGFRSHLLDRVTHGTPMWPPIRRELTPAIGLGVLAGVLIVLLEPLLAPAPPVVPEDDVTIRAVLATIPFRFLYGGITEELLVRWGFMSLVAFGLWRTVGRGTTELSTGLAWIAIVVSAVVFGLGHLPAAMVIYGTLTIEVITWIVIGNAIGGIAFGWLFWRYSIEAAMVAHAMVHVVFVTFAVVVILFLV